VLGRALYADACTLVAQSEQLARSARDVLAGHAGTLRIGFGVATKLLVPAAIARFRASRPGVAIELNDLSTHHQLLALAEGRLDLGFCRLPAPKGWPVLPVVRAHFVAVLPAGYQGVAGLADLQEKPLAILRRDKAPSLRSVHPSGPERAALSGHPVRQRLRRRHRHRGGRHRLDPGPLLHHH
jgi:DNA-binding transcriptional LysR family regulator